MKTVILSAEEAPRRAAEHVKRLFDGKPGAVLALSGGREAKTLVEELSGMYGRGELSLARAKVFAMTALEGDVSGCGSGALIYELCGKTDLREYNCVLLSGDTLDGYDAAIARAGGLDLAVPDLGDGGRLCFNEPAAPYTSLTRRQKLSPAVRRELAPLFGGEGTAPEEALTVGIGTICSARDIMLLALGGGRAEPVRSMLYARTDSVVPAAFLQLPVNVTVYLDAAAAGKL